MVRVLVIDECSEFREWATGQLLRSGFSVIEARDGLAGLQRAVEDSPDWILVDAGLSILDGAGICRQLRGDDSTRDIPIAVWSSFPAEDQKMAALEAGADVFLPRSMRTTNLGEQGWSILASRRPICLFARASNPGEDSPRSLESLALASGAGRR